MTEAEIIKNIGENVAYLRRILKLNQKEFIAAYLSYESGDPTLSSGAFSNLEHGTCKRAMLHAERISAKIGGDPAVFYLPAEEFREVLAEHREVSAQEPELMASEGLGSLELPSSGSESDQESCILKLLSFIGDGLLQGSLKAGDKLSADRDLALELDVPKNGVRDGLRALAQTGLVKTLPGQGTFLAAEPGLLPVKKLAWGLMLSGQKASDVLETRTMVEGGLARMAAIRAEKEDLEGLTRAFRALKSAVDSERPEKILPADGAFHLAAAACAHNRAASDLLEMTQPLLDALAATASWSEGRRKAFLKEHSDICDAIVNRQPERAQAAMEYHLTAARSRYMDL